MSCRYERFALGSVLKQIFPFLGGKDQHSKQNPVSMEARAPWLFLVRTLKGNYLSSLYIFGYHAVVKAGLLNHTSLFWGSFSYISLFICSLHH